MPPAREQPPLDWSWWVAAMLLTPASLWLKLYTAKLTPAPQQQAPSRLAQPDDDIDYIP